MVDRARQAVVKRREVARDAVWGIGDQAFSSLTNFLLSIIVARNVSTEEFGAFTLAFATYTIVLTISRALTSEPLTVRYSNTTTDNWKSATAAATGTALTLGAAVGGAVAIVGLVIGGSVGMSLVVLGASFPGLLLQDAWRYAFFAGRRGHSAMANDMVWAVVLFALLALVMHSDLNAVGALLIWSAGALVAALYGMRQAGVFPSPSKPLHWWREHWDLIPRMTAEAVVLSASAPLTLFVITGVVGITATGIIRGGQVLLNAVNILNQGLRLSSIPTATRIAARSRRSLLKFCAGLAGGLAVSCLAWTTVLLLLPSNLGEALLGETWSGARTVILPLGLMNAFLGLQAGAAVGLRALAVMKRSLTSRTLSASATVGCGLIGSLTGGVTGAAWGMCAGGAIGAVAWWGQFLANERHPPADPAPAEETGPSVPGTAADASDPGQVGDADLPG